MKIFLVVFGASLIVANVFGVINVFDLLGHALGLATPIVLALCLAFVLNVFLTGFETRVFGFMKKSKNKIVNKLQRPLCLILTYLLAFGLLGLLVLVIIPDISETVSYIIEKLPAFLVDAREWLIKTLSKFKIPTKDIPEIDVNSLIIFT